MVLFLTKLIILSLCSRVISELIQAAGISLGKCSSWSSMRDTNGLITIERPPRMIDERI